MTDGSLLLQLALILGCAKAAGAGARRLGQPAVVGEIAAGLLLGPSVLGLVGGKGSFQLPIAAMAQVGVVLLMFLAGLETNLAEVKRAGRVSLLAAAGGVVLPLAAGTLICRGFGVGFWESIYVGTVLTATSVSITAQCLLELGRLGSREGSAILGAAVIDDVLGLLVLSFVLAAHNASGAPSSAVAQAGVTGVTAIAYLAGSWVAGHLALGRMARAATTFPGLRITTAAALTACFLYAWTAERLGGLAAITGAYIAGALLTHSPDREKLAEDLRILGYSIFIPVFFVATGAAAAVQEVRRYALLFAFLCVAAVVTKLVGCGLGARAAGLPALPSLRVGVGMVSRGEVALITAAIGLKAGLLSQSLFSALVLVTLVTTLLTPLLLTLVFDNGRQPRTGEAGTALSVSAADTRGGHKLDYGYAQGKAVR